MVTLCLRSLRVRVPQNPRAQAGINSRIRTQTSDFCRYASTALYRQAVREYRDSRSQHFPFRPYDAVMQYTLAWNRKGLLSLYRDQYEFTGGAHGNTLRSSDTMSLKTGARIPLSAFFPRGTDYRLLILRSVLKQAEENYRREPGIYFDDYRNLIVQNFNPESFYLTPAGLAIYYQQYEIAPYSTGIVVFSVSYAKFRVPFI